VNARLSPPLGQAGEDVLELGLAGQHQVSQLVNEDDQAGGVTALLVAALHLLHQLGQGPQGQVFVMDHGEEEVWQLGEGSVAAPLGVNEDELHLAQVVVHGQAGDHGAGQLGLAAARGATDEDVAHIGAGQPQEQQGALLINADDRRGGESPGAFGVRLIRRTVAGSRRGISMLRK
jgi:hypothetical protein